MALSFYAFDYRSNSNADRGVTESELDALKDRGQSLFRRKQYAEALVCFDEAIRKDAKPPVEVWDNRAATHSKLGDFHAALRDCREIIRRAGDTATGYLRTGQILQLMKKSDTALGMYDLGIKKVPISDANFQLLRSVRDRLNNQMAPEHAVDPIKVLPLEIFMDVLGYLDFKQTVRLLSVSKSWNAVVKSLPQLWLDLDLQSCRHLPRKRSFPKYVQYGKGRTERLSFTRDYGFNESVLIRMLPRLKSIKELAMSHLRDEYPSKWLQVASCKNLRRLHITEAIQIEFEDVDVILRGCRVLEHAEIHGIRSFRPLQGQEPWSQQLRTLALSRAPDRQYGLATPFDLSLSTLCPNLETFELSGFRLEPWSLAHGFVHDLTHLRRLKMKMNDGFGLQLKIPSTIEELILENCQCRPNHLPNIDLSGLRDLRTLSLRDHTNSPPSSMLPGHKDFNSDAWTSLTSLNLSGVSWSDDELTSVFRSDLCAELTHLNLSLTSTSDDTIIALCERNKKLVDVELRATKITGVAVKALVTKFAHQLERLGLSECERISKDAFDWARAMGVYVESRQLTMANKGNARRVRDVM